MKISKAGLNLIKVFEQLRLKAYLPTPNDVWTIGYGHTGDDVYEGLTITGAEADALLVKDVAHFENGVSELVLAPVTQNQFNAVVVLAFNIGLSALRGSTLLRLLNEFDYAGAALQFLRWNQQKGKILGGLIRRRAAEKALFESDFS